MALTPAEFEIALNEKNKRDEELMRAKLAIRVDLLEKIIDGQLALGSSYCAFDDDEILTTNELDEIVRRYKAVGWLKIHYIPRQTNFGPRLEFIWK